MSFCIAKHTTHTFKQIAKSNMFIFFGFRSVVVYNQNRIITKNLLYQIVSICLYSR